MLFQIRNACLRQAAGRIQTNAGNTLHGNGDLTKKLTVKANAFSEGAKAKIEAAGGNVEVI